MKFEDIVKRVKAVHIKYVESDKKRHGKEWARGDYVRGFAADVGALVKLTMAKDGLREIEDLDKKLRHELADCFYSIIIIAEKYEVDLLEAFEKTMDELEERASKDELVKSHSL